jgi:Mannosyl-glycoprotein endo-beta-N-acetylglucosaminidase
VTPTLARAPAADLARFFVEEGAVEGIRGDVAFAQAILETGSFTNDDTVNYNNYAGIGHCDSCPSGWNFATPQDGVRAQIQLLKSYVYEKPEYQNELVDRRLHGPAGCCQTWNELSGVWASGGGYGALIMGIYEDMLEWLYQQRTGTPPPPRPKPAPDQP